jgi:hypothetical protein
MYIKNDETMSRNVWKGLREIWQDEINMRTPKVQKMTALIVALLFGALFCFLAVRYRNFIETDTNGELGWLADMQSILAGNHRFGLVGYTHCPLLPAYLVLPLLKFHIYDISTLRLVPIAFATFSISLFTYVLIDRSRGMIPIVWAIIFPFVFLFQPGFLFWAGALCQQSYSFSIFLISVSWGMLQSKIRFVVLFTLGFLASWISYDYLLMTFFGVFTVRWFVYHGSANMRKKEIFYATLRDVVFLGSGIFFGVFVHFVQIWLYYGSFQKMVTDIIGASYARMGLVNDAVRYPLPPDSINPFVVSRDMLKWFTKTYVGVEGFVNQSVPAYAYLNIIVAIILLSVLLTGYQLLRSRESLHRALIVLGIGFLGIVLTCFSSFFVLPQSSRIHQFHLPRTLLSGFVLIGCIPVMISRYKSENWAVKIDDISLRREIVLPIVGVVACLVSVYGLFFLF